MRPKHPYTAFCLFAALFVFPLLMASQAVPPLTVDASSLSGAQEGGRPKPMPKPKPHPTPRPVPRVTPGRVTFAPRQPPCNAQSPTRGTGREYSENLSGGVKLEMVEIPAGNFCMGSPDSEAGRDKNEGPQHRVTVRSFYIGKYEVTQAQWRAVMGANPSSFRGDDRPVENVLWNDAQEFCGKLSQMTGKEYRLPAEAEWEYACRAGTTPPFAFGANLSSAQANFNGSYPYGGAAKGVNRQETTPVGSFAPNNFGVYDMHGNVWEWCQDWYHENYNGAPEDGQAWESVGKQGYRVWRGGSWGVQGYDCRSAVRGFGDSPDFRGSTPGLRVVSVARS
jgi:formylglycine-generating enzyme required for sulfatase activity